MGEALISAMGIIDGSMGSAMAPKLADWKLHLYDHCPFCIRVELFLGWSKLKYTRVVYGYGDKLGDSKGKYSSGVVLTGKKQLPVLERPDHEYMPESGDIIEAIEQLTGAAWPEASGRADLRDFFDSKGAFKLAGRKLTRPELIQMRELKDWAKEEDVCYAKEKYTKDGFDYDAAVAGRSETLEEMAQLLLGLDKLLLSDASFNENGEKSWDDLCYLPELRTLSCTPGLKWPARLKKYVVDSCEEASVQTYFEHAETPKCDVGTIDRGYLAAAVVSVVAIGAFAYMKFKK